MNFLLQSGRVELAYEATQFKVQISNLSIYLYRIYSTELIRKDFVSSHINSYVEPKTILLYCKSTVFGWSYELICEGKKSLLTIHTLNRIEIRNDNVSHHQRHSYSSLRSNLYLYHIPYTVFIQLKPFTVWKLKPYTPLFVWGLKLVKG